ncbi:hypothetical protein ABT121_44290 [Streptomyces sp. NPDC001928]|uniref:hypothetical protein n=1 Tax=Streptomyces sp. NPDC001928 TaxID=3154404 RepID=UPI00332D80B9
MTGQEAFEQQDDDEAAQGRERQPAEVAGPAPGSAASEACVDCSVSPELFPAELTGGRRAGGLFDVRGVVPAQVLGTPAGLGVQPGGTGRVTFVAAATYWGRGRFRRLPRAAPHTEESLEAILGTQSCLRRELYSLPRD